MALVSCPECQKKVSTYALACPQCALPFPGKQVRGVGQAGTKLHACPDCGCPVSKQAQTCPHCGVILRAEKRADPPKQNTANQITENQNIVEETWLCTHCGTPYTRKVRQEKEVVPNYQTVFPTSSSARRSGDRLLEPVPHQEAVSISNADLSEEQPLEPPPHPEVAITRDAEGSGDRLVEPVPHQEAVSISNADLSKERPLDSIPHSKVTPASDAVNGGGRLLEPVPHQEAVSISNADLSEEQPLEPPPHPEVAITSNAGGSGDRLLEPVPHQEAVSISNADLSEERPLDSTLQSEGTPTSDAGNSGDRPLEAVPPLEVTPTNNGGHNLERPSEPRPRQFKRENVSASPQRRSQLWQDSSFGKEIESFLPRYKRNRKKSIMLGLLVFILIVASVVSGALWQLQGINPFEALVYLRM